MHLLIIRHGERRCGSSEHEDLGLTRRGLRQAQLLSEWLVRIGWRIDVLLCSTLPRAQETAAALVRASVAGPVADDRLREVGSCRPDGTPIPDEAPPPYGFPPRTRREDAARPGGESWNRFTERIGSVLDEVLSIHGRFADRRIAFVCHSGVHNAVHELLGATARYELAVCHTGISHWEYVPASGTEPWILRAHNIAYHLVTDRLSHAPENAS